MDRYKYLYVDSSDDFCPVPSVYTYKKLLRLLVRVSRKSYSCWLKFSWSFLCSYVILSQAHGIIQMEGTTGLSSVMCVFWALTLSRDLNCRCWSHKDLHLKASFASLFRPLKWYMEPLRRISLRMKRSILFGMRQHSVWNRAVSQCVAGDGRRVRWLRSGDMPGLGRGPSLLGWTLI